MNRRDFLWMMSLAGSSVILPSVLSSCAINPVTGQNMLVGLSEEDELRVDRQQAPIQFSTDYGTVHDNELNRYVSKVQKNLAMHSHRPQIP
jgi:predicted Zn-dependent protease